MDRELREVIKSRCMAEPSAMYADLEDIDPYLPPMVTLHTGDKVPAVLVELWHGMMYHAAAELKDNKGLCSFLFHLDFIRQIETHPYRADQPYKRSWEHRYPHDYKPYIFAGEHVGLHGPDGYSPQLMHCLHESTFFVNGRVHNPHVLKIINAAICIDETIRVAHYGDIDAEDMGPEQAIAQIDKEGGEHASIVLQDPVTKELTLEFGALHRSEDVRVTVLPVLDAVLGEALSERRLAFKQLSIVLTSTSHPGLDKEFTANGFDPEVMYKWDPDFKRHPQFTSLRQSTPFKPGDRVELRLSYDVGSTYKQMLEWAYKNEYGQLYRQSYPEYCGDTVLDPKSTYQKAYELAEQRPDVLDITFKFESKGGDPNCASQKLQEVKLIQALVDFEQDESKTYHLLHKGVVVTVIGSCTVQEVEIAASFFNPATRPTDEQLEKAGSRKVSEATRMMPCLVLCCHSKGRHMAACSYTSPTSSAV